MYIEEIVLEGFKSYANRTHIKAMDPEFNAITGFNGSGKSNILDALIFVLGLSNLNQVRANNIQDLIYKQGQAGITKASVTLIFNNNKSELSPPGYEDFKTITVSRIIQTGNAVTTANSAGKFLINGRNVEKKQLVAMFYSVQLNIANPHFLIMQGQVTKVLNMKPKEILGMIEEAAGTSLFESNKVNAFKLMEKKEVKLKEIDRLVIEEIQPSMEKLRAERSAFLQFQQITKELDMLEKFLIAYKYYMLSHRSGQDVLAQLISDSEAMTMAKSDTLKQLEVIKRNYTNIKSNVYSGLSEELDNIEGNIKELSKEIAKNMTTLTHVKDDVAQYSSKIKVQEITCHDLGQTLVEKQTLLACKQTEVSEVLADVTAAQLNYDTLKRRLETECAIDQINSNSSTAVNLADELRELNIKRSYYIKESERLSMQLSQKSKIRQDKLIQLETMKKESLSKNTYLDTIKNQVESTKNELARLAPEVDSYNQLMIEKLNLEGKLTTMQERMDKVTPIMSDYNFHAMIADAPFFSGIASKIKGSIGTLFRVKNRIHLTAIEALAGDRLKNVVVDSQETASFLVKNGRLRRKTTFIPLNSISTNLISRELVIEAQKLVGAHQVHLALDLVEYDDPTLAPAMAYLFGNSFICTTPNASKAVTFHPSIKKRSITLEGDIYEPSGTLSGGAKSSSSNILATLSEINTLNQTQSNDLSKYSHIKQQLHNISEIMASYKLLERQYELKKHELDVAEQSLSNSRYTDTMNQLEEIEANLISLTAQQNQLHKQSIDIDSKIGLLNVEMTRDRGSKEDEIKRIKTQLEASKSCLESKKRIAKSGKLDITELDMELELLFKEQESQKRETGQLKLQIDTLLTKEKELADVLTRLRSNNGQLNTVYLTKKSELESHTKELQLLSLEITQYQDSMNAIELELKKLEFKRQKIEKDTHENQASLRGLINKHEWIAHEEKYFNLPNTNYDFSSVHNSQTNEPNASKLHELNTRHQELADKKALFKDKINMKAMVLFEKLEAEHNDLLKKKDIIMHDKIKIVTSIEEINEKKNQTLSKVISQVNKDFGSLYSTLLPGASAHLVPPPGLTELDGLTVQIRFGSTIKENLSELSGGQRSLMALSLLLSLSMTKPAPMYILDEVDAALDLSHTQNIGKLIKRHFSNSQFIVVSLKEGMFNHANQLYKTQFINGTSTVEKISGGH